MDSQQKIKNGLLIFMVLLPGLLFIGSLWYAGYSIRWAGLLLIFIILLMVRRYFVRSVKEATTEVVEQIMDKRADKEQEETDPVDEMQE